MASQSQGLRQVQKQTQNLVLAPQLRQSLKILQVPAQELRTAILEELQTNPVLEELSGNDESLDAEVVEQESPESPEENPGIEEIGDPRDGEADSEVDSDNADDSDRESADNLEEMNFEDQFAVLNEMQEDLREHYEAEYEGEAQLANSQADQKRQFFFDSLVEETSLQEHLMGQLKLADISESELEAARYLVGSLDENGFLSAPLSDLALTSELPLSDLQNAHTVLKNFDPVGIAATGLRECLLHQLEQNGEIESPAYVVVRDHLHLLLRRRVPDLARKLSLPNDDIHELIERIAELDPAPGRRFSIDTNHSISPDATVERIGDEWVISLTNDFIPRLRINKTYKDLIAKGKLEAKEKDYVRNQMRAGKFLINAIEQRQNTIERITGKLIERQTEFFEKGVSGLKPLTMAEMADEIGVHETTISRAISSKYLQTSHGIFPFKYFFTHGYVGKDGDLVSNTSVKELIGSIIEKEDPAKPLSDRKIVDILSERDVKLARRTVAKYREELGILPTNLRRRY
jgi:RNA polymerase sigma-54 factor